jgi:hypothetical protein
MHAYLRMRKTRPGKAALLLALTPLLGCTRETNRGPVQWTASDPASPEGQTDAQAWSRSTSNDEDVPVIVPLSRTKAPPPPPRQFVGKVELPGGASLAARATVCDVRAFPEETREVTGRGETDVATVVVGGSDEVYASGLSYRDVVGFFDRTLLRDGFQEPSRTATRTATIWSARSPDGQVVHLAVRNTRPTTIEIVEGDARVGSSSVGVANAQPATSSACGPR